MTPSQLNTAANSLRPSSILDNGEVEPESGNEEAELRSKAVESEQEAKNDSDSEEEVEAEQEVNGDELKGDESEIEGQREEGGNSANSDVELVIDYGGKYYTVTVLVSGVVALFYIDDEEGSQSAVLEQLVAKQKTARSRRQQRRSRPDRETGIHHPPPSPHTSTLRIEIYRGNMHSFQLPDCGGQ